MIGHYFFVSLVKFNFENHVSLSNFIHDGSHPNFLFKLKPMQ